MSMSQDHAKNIRYLVKKMIKESKTRWEEPLTVHFDEMIHDELVQELVVKIMNRFHHTLSGDRGKDKVVTITFTKFYTIDIVRHRLLDALMKVTT